MARKATTVVGFCPTHAHAEEAVDRLRLSGFRNTDVSALMRDGGEISCGVLAWAAGPDISTNDARQHQAWISTGGIVIWVQCDNADWERRAERVLQSTAAVAGAC
jgi:hypothetical protein